MFKAENFSIIAGTGACNAMCPYCVSKMTGIKEIGLQAQPINWRNFDKAAKLASDWGVNSVMITGKGEPTLFPNQISDYLTHLKKFDFPLIDLQTNGLLLNRQSERYQKYLKTWYELGLSFIAISIVHYDPEINKKIYVPDDKNYINLENIVNQIHEIGLSVRLSVTMFNGGIDSQFKTKKMIEYAKYLHVEQLTLRKMAKAQNCENQTVGKWAAEHLLSDNQIEEIRNYIHNNGVALLNSGHGAVIYDVDGQNVCLSNALTLDTNPENTRQIIFYPNGRVRFDWQYQGAVIL